MKEDPAVLLADVSFAYGPEKTIISSLNINLPRNSATAILGPNGTGKTTLLHLMLGWLKPRQGRILLLGRDLNTWDGASRGRTLSLLPQKEPVNFEYTVLEYILLGRAPYLKPLQSPGAVDFKIATNALKLTGLEEMENSRLPTLSGGETQLVLLSRSLTQDPDILLLDEPTNHLDLKNKHHMIELLSKFKQQGKTIIFTTHDPDLASSLADFLILMGNHGQVLHGSFQELFTGENLTNIYGLPVKILEIDGQRKVLVK